MSVSEHNTDDKFERELAALGHAYRSNLDANDAVPPGVDDAIRAAARRAVYARPQPLRKSWLFGWGGPVAAAAVVVLTVSIGMLSLEEQPELAPEELKKAITPRPAKPTSEANVSAEVAAPQAPVAAAPERRVQKLLEKRKDNAADAFPGQGEAQALRDNKPQPELARQMPQEQSDPVVASGLLVPAMPAKKSASIGQRDSSEADLITRPSQAPATTAPALASAPATAPVKPTLSGKAQTPAAPASFEKEKADKDHFSAEQKITNDARTRLASPVVARQPLNEAVAQNKPLPAPFAAPEPPADKATSRDTAQPALGAATASGAVQPLSGEKQGSAAAPQDFRLKGRDKLEEVKAPQEWLKQITTLKAQGKTKEAEEELAKFRKRYPDYVLPLELRK